MRKAVSKRKENAEEQQNLDGGVLMMERCPKCGSSQVTTKNTIVERGFAVCYVDYCECQKCGNIWEPKRTIEVCLSWQNWDIPPLNVPDGSTVRITYPDGYTWDAKLTYLDPTHFMVNGSTYHKDQFAEMLDRTPGTKVELVDGESKSKNKKLLRSRSKSNPRYYVAGYYDRRYCGLAESYKVDTVSEVEDKVWGMLQHGNYVEVTDIETGNRETFDPDEIGCDDCGIDLRTIRSASHRPSMCSICGQPMGATPSYSKWDPKQRVCANCRNRQEQEDYLNGVVTYSKKGRFFVWMKKGGKE